MPIVRVYGCDNCGNEFEVFHHNREEPAPDTCPFCGGVSEAPRIPIPSGANIGGSAIARSVDKMYRDTEKASEVRAQMAGDKSLKITNMKDNLREGDVAAIAPNNAVTKYAEEAGHQYFTKDMGALISGTKNGSIRDTGAVGLSAIQKGHGGTTPVSVPTGAAMGSWGGGFKRS